MRETNVTTSSQPVIELDGLSVRLGRRPVLVDLRASVKGRALGLLGPNGAGKTTLLRTLLGFFPVTSGRAAVLGHQVGTDIKAIRSLVGYMPESDAHLGNVTAVRMVRFLAELSGLPPGPALERAHEALFFVGLDEARYRKVGTFSTGMKQMVKLAQAVVHGPGLLMLDEPTNGLDPPARKRMLDLICKIRDRGETQILLSSHLLHDVETVCDEVLILKKGRVAAQVDLEAERRADRSFVELELLEPSDAFMEAAQRLGCETATVDQRRIKLVLPSGIGVRELYDAAEGAGIAFRRLDHKRNSLQEIFLDAMEDHDGGV
jgi:ABC-2 type transport system ATP-binding protein